MTILEEIKGANRLYHTEEFLDLLRRAGEEIDRLKGAKMSKHPPGEWFVSGNNVEFTRETEGMKVHGHICNLGDSTRNLIQRSANAQLIAAAPELLEALKAAEWGGRTVGGNCYCPVCLGWKPPGCEKEKEGHTPDCIIAAAIKKAEGGES